MVEECWFEGRRTGFFCYDPRKGLQGRHYLKQIVNEMRFLSSFLGICDPCFSRPPQSHLLVLAHPLFAGIASIDIHDVLDRGDDVLDSVLDLRFLRGEGSLAA